MFKVYASPDEVYVRATYIYKKNNETKAYADGKFTRQLTTSELKDIFINGAVIQASNVLYKPVSLKITAGVATITYVTAEVDEKNADAKTSQADQKENADVKVTPADAASTTVVASLTSKADA